MGKGKRNKAKKNARVSGNADTPAAAAEQPVPSASDSRNADTSAGAPPSNARARSHRPLGMGPDSYTEQGQPQYVLLSERTLFLYRTVALFNSMEGDSWKEDYKKETTRSVDVNGIICDKEGFSGVLFDKEVGYYEQNAFGALMYTMDALFHVNDHFPAGAKKTPHQVAELLDHFFPLLLCDIWEFLVKKDVDIADLMGDTRQSFESSNLADVPA